MNPLSSFFVRVGDLIRAEPWNAAGWAIRRMRLIAGAGVRLKETPNGTIVSFDGRPQKFVGRWKCQLVSDNEVSIRPGAINEVKATIGGIPLEGNSKSEPPSLKMPALVLDGQQFGWIAAEVTCSLKDWSVQTVEVVQVAALDTEDGIAPKAGTGKSVFAGGFPNLKGRRARFPIARIARVNSRVVLWQIAYFDVQHRIKTNAKSPTADEGRHFFYV